MSPAGDYRIIGGGLTVLVLVALGLWGEFYEPGQTVWNVLLAVIVIGLIVLAIAGQRYFRAHADEIGEARFDTCNKDDI